MRVVAVVLICAIAFSPRAGAAPTSPLCDSGTYRKAHPLICDTGEGFPTLGGGGTGGSGQDGLIGRILGGLGGLL